MPSLNPQWRLRLQALLASVLAVWLGINIASEAYLPAFAAGAALLLLLLVKMQPVPLPALLLGLCCAGMMIGNRGFAQLSPSAGLPLFPAEITFVLAGGLLLLKACLERSRPWRGDLLNLAILVWILASSARLPHDLNHEGLTALRDYATVYYAGFFFVAQAACEKETSRRFLHGTLRFAPLLMLLSYTAFTCFPDFFLGPASLNGIPVIYFKGDLAGTFMSVGAALWFVRYEQERRLPALLLGLLLTAGMLSTLNRASLFGLVLAVGILALRGRWRTGAWLGLSAAALVLTLLMVLELRNQSWKDSPLLDAAEQLQSVADPGGLRSYSSEQVGNKGDNNRFRAVWWKTCINETLSENPGFGLGWGHDLAAPFLRTYFPEAVDDFGARSPHNILVTLFARTGVLGLGTFLLVLLAVAAGTWKAMNGKDPATTGAWLAGWIILASACFGVVLEGPMGAVLFWSFLGCANAERERVVRTIPGPAA